MQIHPIARYVFNVTLTFFIFSMLGLNRAAIGFNDIFLFGSISPNNIFLALIVANLEYFLVWATIKMVVGIAKS